MSTTWDDICMSVKGWAKTAQDKAEELSEQAAVRLKCSAKRAELGEEYAKLGKLTYDQALEPQSDNEGHIAQSMAHISELLADIEALQQRINAE